MDRGIETFVQVGKQILRRFDGATVDFTRRGGLFVVQCQVVVPMLLALVDEEPAGETLDLPLVDEEMERELMGREEVEPPVAIEVLATSRAETSWTHSLAISILVQRLCPSSWERQQTSVTTTKPARLTRHPMRQLLPEDRGRRSNRHSLDSHRYSVQTDAISLEKMGNRDPFASRSLAAFARYVGQSTHSWQSSTTHAHY